MGGLEEPACRLAVRSTLLSGDSGSRTMRRRRLREIWRSAWLMPSNSPRLGRGKRRKSLNRAMNPQSVREPTAPIEETMNSDLKSLTVGDLDVKEPFSTVGGVE